MPELHTGNHIEEMAIARFDRNPTLYFGFASDNKDSRSLPLSVVNSTGHRNTLIFISKRWSVENGVPYENKIY
ncbi:MAG: hypothetical protein KZQ82_18610, partial [Candidatus Thiodiazotropha sp. (ex Lucinoma annulata)]|nr:hypothetical protein [Candidatus Thiodiazotropha sp. (ex Lucinoma annulata)]